MLDPKFIRENSERVIKNTKERGMDISVVSDWLNVDEELRDLKQKTDQLKQRRNELAEMLKDPEKRSDETIAEGKQLKEELQPLEEKQQGLQEKWMGLIQQIPNIHPQSVPVAANEEGNVVLRKEGKKPKFDFEAKDHLTLGEDLGIIDFEAGAKVAGSQFYYLKGDAVRLEFALMQYGIDFLAKKGYELVITPDMARSRYYLGTGYAPKGEEAQIYEIDGDDLGLIATAEITMAGLHADQIMDESELPKKYAALSHCFRREAGAYGKYSKGLYRVHQFAKLEMFAYCTPDQSEDIHQEFLAIEEEIAQELGLHYQVVEMCTGDLGAIAARKYDLEAWMPGRNDYGEITSTSNCTDFQARNLEIRYKDGDGANQYLHMLNGTALTSSRIPLAIMENYQQEDGSILIPEVLRPYMGKDVIASS
jgi:seryl-tRNA synthetase